jgi:hypothetical protein
MPATRTVSLGIWISPVRATSPQARREWPISGAHGLQGHTTRTARDIALEFDLLGGLADAYTSRNTPASPSAPPPTTCPGPRRPGRHRPAPPPGPPGDRRKRRHPPGDRHDRGHPGRQAPGVPVGGGLGGPGPGPSHHRSAGSVSGFEAPDLWAWRAANYRPRSMVVAAAGAWTIMSWRT